VLLLRKQYSFVALCWVVSESSETFECSNNLIGGLKLAHTGSMRICWDIMPCSPVKPTDISKEHLDCYVPPKCQLTFTELNSIISPNTELLIATAVKTPNPTYHNC
jgi:hypothetical protein